MIIIELKSAGLGNCMFQYALGRRLSLEYETDLKIDISNMGGYQLPFRHHEDEELQKLFKSSLGAFNITYEIASCNEVAKLRGWGDVRKFGNRLTRKVRRIFNCYPKTYIKEKTPHGFDKDVCDCGNSAYLDGYFINRHYFESVENHIRKEFTFRHPLDGKNIELLRQIMTTNSVSIHVRRGDYTVAQMTSGIFNILDIEYYKKAVKVISEMVDNPKFYVFSDDLQWVRENLGFIHDIVIPSDKRSQQPWIDLRLMSCCKHNITANSTFSWWGAWLNQEPNKIVVVPEKWYRNPELNNSVRSLILGSWIEI